MAMRRHEQLGGAGVAVLTALALLAQPLTPLAAAAGQAPAKTPTTTKTAAPATGGAAKTTPASAGQAAATGTVPDIGWPRYYQTGAGTQITIYQPQIAEWPNQKHIVGYAAVSV